MVKKIKFTGKIGKNGKNWKKFTFIKTSPQNLKLDQNPRSDINYQQIKLLFLMCK